MKIKLGKTKQIEITEVTNISGRFKDSSCYTITGRADLKLFKADIKSFDERYGEWFDENDYIEFWADSYENCFTFLKETVSHYLECFNKSQYIDDSRGGFWDIDNIEDYLGCYIKAGKYIEIDGNETQKQLIIKCNEVTERLHYSLRKTSELVHKLDDTGILTYIK